MSVLLYEVKDRVAYITMNRPEKHNAINHEMLRELSNAFRDVKTNPAVWAAIITGAGDDAFSSGHDLSDVEKAARSGPQEDTTDDLFVYMSEIWKPIVAAINGLCLAQGAGIALLSDIRIASERACFTCPHVKRGLSSISGPSVVAHRMPLGIALEYALTGERITMAEAQRWGMVNRVVAHEELMPAAEAMARKILENAPLAVRAMKEACIRNQDLSLRQRVALAGLIAARVRRSMDCKDG